MSIQPYLPRSLNQELCATLSKWTTTQTETLITTQKKLFEALRTKGELERKLTELQKEIEIQQSAFQNLQMSHRTLLRNLNSWKTRTIRAESQLQSLQYRTTLQQKQFEDLDIKHRRLCQYFDSIQKEVFSIVQQLNQWHPSNQHFRERKGTLVAMAFFTLCSCTSSPAACLRTKRALSLLFTALVVDTIESTNPIRLQQLKNKISSLLNQLSVLQTIR